MMVAASCAPADPRRTHHDKTVTNQQQTPRTASSGASTRAGKNVVYRGGSAKPTNLTPRPGVDATGLSTFDNLGAFKPGDKVQVIDVDKLKHLTATPDAPPAGHVSIAPRDPSQVADWAATRGTDTVHPYTQELIDALLEPMKIPKGGQ